MYFCFAVLGAASLEMQGHCPKEKSAPHRLFPMLCHLALQHSHTASECPDQTCSWTGKVCSWGKVLEMVKSSANAVIGTSFHPACLPGKSASPEHRSMHPPTELLGSKHVPALRNAKGKLKLQDNSDVSNV